MKIRTLVPFVTALLTSCSATVESLQNELAIPTDEEKITYQAKSCAFKELGIITSSKRSGEDFKAMLLALDRNNIQTDFIDRVVMLVLTQSFYNPHIASPTARISFILEGDYQDVYGVDEESGTYPVFYAATKALKNHHSKYQLKDIVRLIDRYYPKRLVVESRLQSFIEKNKRTIRRTPSLKQYFFRGNQTIKAPETLVRPELMTVLHNFNRDDQKYALDNTLQPYASQKIGGDILCNYDLGLYDHGVFLKTKALGEAVTISYNEGARYFLASVSQQNSEFKSLKDGFYIRGVSRLGMRPAICALENKRSQIVIMSNKDRDPAQLIFNLIHDFNLDYNQQAIKSSMNAGRTIKILNPMRYAIESNVLKDEDIDDLVKLHIPVYHYSPLGNITIINDLNLYTDGRSNIAPTCF